MRRIYLDNAATTPLNAEVLAAMMPYLTEKFGNPSSIYFYGRDARMAIENARKSIAQSLNVGPGEIFFTSGGTESTNTAINAAIYDLGCRHIITSSIEHHATLHSISHLADREKIPVSFVNMSPNGHVDLNSLETLLSAAKDRTLVALMHANNEIGNLLKIKAVGEICNKYNAIFCCDTVQTVGHYPIDLSTIPVHFIYGSAHKFCGPKGIGILYVNKDIQIKPFINGGSQERNRRAGTENIYGIVGFAKALELALKNINEDSAYISDLKNYMYQQLLMNIPEVTFNGDTMGSCLYTVLSASFPMNEKSEMLLYNLDIAGICASGGSACTSGSNSVSHVITGVYGKNAENIVPVRFSFSRNNTKEEIDIVIDELKKIL